MKSLNYKELNVLVKEINEKLKGNHITNISVLSSSDILLAFSYYRKEKLLISINHHAPFLSLVDSSLSIPSILGHLTEELRKNIKDTVIEEIMTIENERVVKIKIIKTDEFFTRIPLFLFIELIPTHPNLILTDENEKIIFASHYSSLDSKRVLIKGMKYPPLINNKVNDGLDINLDRFKEDVNSYLPSLLTNRLKEKYHKLVLTIKNRIKKNKNKVNVLNKEIEEAKNTLIYQTYGEMILALMYDENELNNYLKENNVPYDKEKSPIDNANSFFKKYKKAKQTILIDEEQLNKNEDELKELEDDLLSLEEADESLYLLLSSKYLKAPIPKQEINKLTPYYVTIDGTKIGFGRNAQQNDLLTFKKAKDDYYFLHVENVHANHVIIMKSNPSDNDKENAAMLALALINKEAGNVQIALRKDIKKGSTAGQVLLNKYSVIKINNVTNKIKNALDKAKRISF